METNLNPSLHQEIAKILLCYLLSSTEAIRSAAQSAVTLLIQYYGMNGRQLVLDILLPSLLETLESGDISKIPPEDLIIYKNPEEAVAMAIKKAEVKEDEVKITNVDRKKDSSRASRRGMFGADVIEDEDWAERIKREKMKKLALERSGGMSDVASKAHEEVGSIAACKLFTKYR
jgi:hypothetical protein